VERRVGHRAPTVALFCAGMLLAISLLLPYRELILITPDHPAGLRLSSYLGRVEGPVELVLEAVGLHGPASLLALSELERSLALAAATVMCLLLVAATFVHNRWAALLALPALVFPVIVIADTGRWMQPIVSSVTATAGSPTAMAPFPLWGSLAGDGLALDIRPAGGLLLAIAASLTVLVGLWLHRRAYKKGSGEAPGPSP
jgi:hypothetical protein